MGFCVEVKQPSLSVFKEFYVRVERESRKKLKVVQSDKGGEYTGLFEEYCKTQCIKLEYTVPKTPELNGHVERMN